jgi:hypothetical protein
VASATPPAHCPSSAHTPHSTWLIEHIYPI